MKSYSIYVFLVGLLSLRMIILRFIHVVAYIYSSFFHCYYFISWIYKTHLFIHFLIVVGPREQLLCINLPPTRCVPACVWTCAFASPEETGRRSMAESQRRYIFYLLWSGQIIFQIVGPFYIFSSSFMRISFLRQGRKKRGKFPDKWNGKSETDS